MLQSFKELKHYLLFSISFVLIAVYYVFIAYIQNYFFLFDDYQLIRDAQHNSILRIFGTGLIGFYRPIVFTLLKMQFSIFAWDFPGGYMAVSIIIHFFNAFLVSWLGKLLLGTDNLFYVFSPIIFLLSPWVGECIFWLSCQFDIFAATGILMALVFALKADNKINTLSKKVFYLLIMMFSGFLSLFSKEMSVTLPLLLMTVMLFRYNFMTLIRHKLFIIEFLLLIMIVSIYIFARKIHLGSFSGGAYGNITILYKSINPIKIIHSVFIPPINPSINIVYFYGSKLFIFIVVNICICAFICRFRESLITTIGFVLSLIPVLWSRIGFLGTDGGRILYIPNIFISIGLGIGLYSMLKISCKWINLNGLIYIILLRGFAIVFAIYLLVSLNYQKGIWDQSCTLSKYCLDTFKKHIHKGDHFYIKNLPFRFIQGPYILKSYAFSYYYDNDDIKVRANKNIISYKNGEVFLIAKEKDEFSQYEKNDKEIIVNFKY